MADFKVIRERKDDKFEKKVKELLNQGYELVNWSHDGEGSPNRAQHFGYLVLR